MLKSINKVIKVLSLSDIALLTGLGFFTPIFAIFIAQKITLGDAGEAARVAGFAMAIYWGLKSCLQIPFGSYLDKEQGEKDDLYFVVIGNILATISVFGYIFSSAAWHIYLLSALYSLGMAMNIPGWTAMFTRHIDKGKEAFEWATRSTAIGIGAGIAGALGGIITEQFGFNVLFVLSGVFVLLSSLVLFFIYDDLVPRKKKTKIPETKIIQDPRLPKQ